MQDEFEVEFIMKEKTSKQKFNSNQEIYLLYVHCSKIFQCGLISLYYNGINLNFIDKNTKLSKIFKKEIKHPLIKVLSKDNQILKKKNNTEIIFSNDNTKKNNLLNIKIDKGTVSENLNLIQNNEIIDHIFFCEEKIESNEVIPCFFNQIANKVINKLSINPKFLTVIDDMKNCHDLKCFNELKELEIIGEKKSINLIKNIQYDIRNIHFPKLKRLMLKNIAIKFNNNKISFNNLDKLDLYNSYLILDNKQQDDNNININNEINNTDNNLQPQLLFTSLSYLGLNYIYYTDLCEQLDIIMKRTKSVDILKLKLDSIEFNTPFNFTEFCVSNQKNIEKVKNIELNLKSKFIFEETTTKDQKKCVDKFLRKTTKLKLTPFSKFTEKELNYFGAKLSNINLLKMEMLNIEKEDELKKFLNFYPDLEYISLDEKYNYLIPSKIYKLNMHSIDDIIKNKTQFKNFINNLKVDKLEKIEIPFFEFDRDNKTLKILGDLLPMDNNDNDNNNENIKITDLEEIFILLKKILFNIPYIDKLTLQNFETENKASYLNNFLIGFINLLSSPKINKLKLIDVYIDKGIVEKFSFIFMNSSSCLQSLELNNIKILKDEMQFLFYTLLFQIDYKKLSKLKLCNLDINQTFLQVCEEYNIFKKVDYIHLDSLDNFDLIKNIILNLDTNTAIAFKNLNITEEELVNYLVDNGDYLKKLVLDLEGIKLFDVLSKDEISLKDCRNLKIYESFDNFEDNSKFSFLENKWLQMKKLRKLYVYIKNANSNSNKSKEKELISLFKYIKNII